MEGYPGNLPSHAPTYDQPMVVQMSEPHRQALLEIMQTYPRYVVEAEYKIALQSGLQTWRSVASTPNSSIYSGASSSDISIPASESSRSERTSTSSRMSWTSGATETRSRCYVPDLVTPDAMLPTDTTCQQFKSYSGSKPPGGRPWCTFDPACHSNGFTKRSDWKGHEKTFHETGQLVACHHPGCNFLGYHTNDFDSHHGSEHSDCHQTCHGTIPLNKTVFACGMVGCDAFFVGTVSKGKNTAWDQSRKHIAEHMKDPRITPSSWSYSVLIRNLLRQPATAEFWHKAVCAKYGRDPRHWPAFEWRQRNPDTLKYQLETTRFGGLELFIQMTMDAGSRHLQSRPFRLSRPKSELVLPGSVETITARQHGQPYSTSPERDRFAQSSSHVHAPFEWESGHWPYADAGSQSLGDADCDRAVPQCELDSRLESRIDPQLLGVEIRPTARWSASQTQAARIKENGKISEAADDLLSFEEMIDGF